MTEALEAAQRGLARVWIDFESGLATVPLIARLASGRLRVADYRALLLNLRQQVVEGGRWITRAASSLGAGHEELRSMFIRHAAAEHRDFLLLEANFVAAGGDPAAIRPGRGLLVARQPEFQCLGEWIRGEAPRGLRDRS